MRRITRLLTRTFLVAAVLGTALTGQEAQAVPSGTVDIAGLGNVSITFGVGTAFVDFAAPLPGLPGNVIVTGGTFPPLTAGNFGAIADVSLPLGGTVPDFLVVPTPGPRFSFDLEQLLPGNFGLISLLQTASGVTVSVSVAGIVTDLNDSTTVPYKGLFSANLTAPDVDTIAEVLAKVAANQTITSSWSAEFTTNIPEPSSLLLVGLGLGVGTVGRFIARRGKGRS